jgi:hypothetical protein
MKKGAVVDWFLHFGCGAAGTGIAIGLSSLAGAQQAAMIVAVPVFAVVGFVREWSQHRDDKPVFTGHRVSEALAWGVGAASVVGAAAAF